MPPPMIPKTELPKAPDPAVDPAGYLRSINAVREQSKKVLERARRGSRGDLVHFEVDMGKFGDTTSFVVGLIKVCFALHFSPSSSCPFLSYSFPSYYYTSFEISDWNWNWSRNWKHKLIEILSQRDFAPDYSTIPPHGRWQHFNVGGRDRIGILLSSWGKDVDPSERCRRLLDLFLVSVLLDAGAGNSWSYTSNENGRTYRRSEGLAIASLEMFKAGLFSGDERRPWRVDAQGLKSLTVEKMAEGLQVSANNPLAGLEGRTGLLIRLADALENKTLFGNDCRPGNMLGLSFPFSKRIYSMLMNSDRLPPVPPPHPRLLDPHRPTPNPLVPPYGRSSPHLACIPHLSRRHCPRRRLAAQHPTIDPPPHLRSLGRHCSVSQTDAMALLFTHAAHVQTHENPFRRR